MSEVTAPVEQLTPQVHFMCVMGMHWWGEWTPAGDVELRPCLRGCGMFEVQRLGGF